MEKETKKTIKDFVDKEIVINRIVERASMDGNVKGLVVTLTFTGIEHTVFIDKAKVGRRLKQVKDLLPLAAMITKGKRFYEIN